MLLFLLPIGILIYFWDRHNLKQSLELFDDYIHKMQRADFEDVQKMKRIDTMFYENGYTIVQNKTTTLIVEKKHFNIGIFFMMIGLLYYVGFFGYILYFHFFQKPRRLCIDLSREIPLSKC